MYFSKFLHIALKHHIYWPRNFLLFKRFLLFMYYFFFFDVDPLKHFFYFLCLAALGLGCCVHALSSCRRWGLLFTLVLRLFIVVAPLLWDMGSGCRGLGGCGSQAQQLWHMRLVALQHVRSS